METGFFLPATMHLNPRWAVPGGLFFVLALPMLLPVSHAPSPPAYCNALSVVLWGATLLWVYGSAPFRGPVCPPQLGRTPVRWLLLALSVIAVMSLVHVLAGRYGYLGVTVQGVTTLALASLVMVAGWYAAAAERPRVLAEDVAWAVVACGVVNAALGWVQYFGWHEPDWWLNSLREMGRVYANLRQPNLLAQVLCLAVVATVWLRLTGRLSALGAAFLLVVLTPAVAFTGSRMGFVMLVLLLPLFQWGASERRRALLWSLAPLMLYLLVWWGLQAWQQQAGVEFYGASRLKEADATGLRWPLWRNSLSISWLHPWLGCGFQQFNYCFTHADLPDRAPANFNHAHNLALNFLVEFGWPAGLLITLLLAVGFWQLRPRRGDAASSLYFVLLAIASVHAMLEFPWWHLYFLLPVAFITGLACAGRSDGGWWPSLTLQQPFQRAGWWLAAGLISMLAGTYFAWSYASLRPVYTTVGEKITVAEGLRRGTRALLFQDHVEYSLVMAVSDGAAPDKMKEVLSFFHLSSRGHMDAKFLLRYAQVAAIAGEVDLSHHLMWRALQIDPDVAAEAGVAAQLSDHPALRAVVEYARDPYPVNLPLKQIEALR